MSIKTNIISLLMISTSMILLSCSNDSSSNVGSADVTSMKGIEEFVGEKITAKGSLECNKEGAPDKAGAHYLKFQDETELKFPMMTTCG